MKYFFLSLIAVFLSIASFAIGPITGTTSICAGSTATLSDTTSGGTWLSGNTSVAAIGSTGVYYGVSAGSSIITYYVGGYIATATVIVYPNPGPITGPSVVCTGSTITLTDAGGGVWSSNNTSVAAVGSSSGIVTGVSAGVANITYSFGVCSDYHSVTVDPTPSAIAGSTSICVGTSTVLTDPTSGGVWASSAGGVASVGSPTGVVYGLSLGTSTISYSIGACSVFHSMRVTAGAGTITGTTLFCSGSSVTLSDSSSGGIWTSNNTLVATVGSSSGIVTGVAAGSAIISYIMGGCLTYTDITVSAGAGTISGSTSICMGSSTTLTDGTSGGSWSSSSTGIATIGATTGIVTPVSPGVVTIYYTLGGCTATFTLTVTPEAGTITGPSVVCTGSTVTLYDSSGSGTWSSSGSSVAAVGSASGVVTGVSSGVVNIYYLLGGCGAYHSMTVVPGPAVIAGPTGVCIGSTITLTDATLGGTWSSSNTAIATVGLSTGVVTPVSAGVVTIYYTVGSCTVSYLVTITAGGGTIYGPSSVCVGYSAYLTDSVTGGVWASSNTSVATVGSSGLIIGVSAGVVNIYYSVGGCTAYHTFTVTPGGGIITGPTTVCSGSIITLSDSTSGTWTSSNPSVAAIIETSGVVTGVSSGTVIITHTVGSCSSYYTVSVATGGTIVAPSTICAGSYIVLTDTTTGGTWSSANSSIAVVGSSGIVTGVSSGVTNIYYTVSGCSSYHTVTVTPGAGTIAGATALCTGTSATLTDATGGGTWSSSNTAIATVGSTGIVTAVSAGVVTIYYTAGSCATYHTMTVTTSPGPISGPTTVCAGATIVLTDGTGGGVWSSANSAVAGVGSLTGMVTGVAAGVTNIYYSIGSCSAYHTETVVPGAGVISGASAVCVGTSITLTDASGGGIWTSSNTSLATVGTGGSVYGVAAGGVIISYIVGGCIATHTVSITSGAGTITGPSTVCVGSAITLTDSIGGGAWSSSDYPVAYVGSSLGTVTGYSAGTATIYYTIGGCVASHIVTVVPGSGTITGPTTICQGTTITLSDGTSGGTWSSSATTIATVGSTGIVYGVASGVVTIYYTIGSCTASHTMTVSPSPGVISGPNTVCVGSVITLTDGTSGGIWTSGSPTIASAGSITGVVTGVASGAATIYYSIGSCSAYHMVTVNPAPGAISGPSAVCVGSTVTLVDAGGGTWTSGSTTIASVGSPTGIVTGVSAGVTNIYYTLGGCSAYHTMTVEAPPAAISGGSSVCAGSNITLSDSTSGGAWSSSNYSIAGLSSTSGMVTGVSAGTAIIYYTVGACSAYHVITVNPAPTAISGPTSVCAGSTITLTDAVGGGAWTSGNTSLATVVSGTGVVTGVSAGVVNIYYAIGTCSVYHSVTVVAPPATIAGYSAVCAGSTIALTDITSGGTWSSSNGSVATIGTASGVVTGVSAGTATIYYFVGGCGTYHNITVNLTPAAIAGPTALCAGSAITLTDPTSGGTWSSSNTSVATVSSGVVTGVTGGSVTIYYTIGSCSADLAVTVRSLPASITGGTSVCSGSTYTVSDSTGGGIWISSNTSVAAIGSSGLVYGVSAGTSVIDYTVAGCMVHSTIVVYPVPAAILGPSAVCSGSSITLTDATGGGSWTSSSTLIATVGAITGVVTGSLSGVVTIYYTVGECGASHMVTVNPTPAAISGPDQVCVGSTIVLTDGIGGGSWTSGNTSVASVGYSTGVVSGVATGATNIYYTIGSCAVYHTVTVDPVPSVATIAGASSVAYGFTTTLTDATSGGVWTSSNTSYAIVGASTGVVTGVTLGTLNIIYTVTNSFGCSANSEHAFTVTSPYLTGRTAGNSDDVKVLPNPNNGEFLISGTLGTGNEDVSLEITNMLGQVVYSHVTSVNNGQINEPVSLGGGLSNGVYILNIRSGQQNLVVRFWLEK